MQALPSDSDDTGSDENAHENRPSGFDGLSPRFPDTGSKMPTVVWSPDINDLRHPLVIRFAQVFRALRTSNGIIQAKDFDLDAFSGLREWMTILEVDKGSTVFRYSHYGEGISTVRGYSKKDTGTADHGDHISVFFQDVYRAAQKRKEWVVTVHAPPKQIFARSWESLVVPLADAAGNIVQLINISVPDNELRAGLEIIPDPVLIVDADQIVRYANRPAREMFNRQSYLGANMDLFTFAGIDLEMPAPPQELAKSHAVHDVISIVLSGTMIERFLLTISATEQFGSAFYVITLRPAVEQNLDPTTA